MKKQADLNKVINHLISRIAELEKDKAVLLALLESEENEEESGVGE